jgi:UDP-N-acetylmuramate dehydrogenase
MSINIQQNIPLAPLTTFKIGGRAKFFIEVKTREDLSEAAEWAKEKGEKLYILGGGSNILINDKGVDGLVVKMANNDITIKGERIECGAGASLAKTASMAIAENLSGMEWTVGIPGATLGGAARGNAEAFDAPIADIVETVEVFDLQKNKFIILSNRECKFSYRSSIFKENNNYIIWQLVLKLKKEKPETIQELVKKSVEHRSGKYPKLSNAGSIFKNIPAEIFKKENPMLYDKIMEGKITRLNNIGAGLLIDTLGLKGKTIGGAKISLEHANFIVNTGKATAEDVAMLISYIKQQVRDRLKIQLQEEIKYLGF